MKYSVHKKLLCKFSKLSKFNAFILLVYYTNTNASILVYKFCPERTGFNMYAEYTRQKLTFLALHPWSKLFLNHPITFACRNTTYIIIIITKGSRTGVPCN